MEHPGANPNLLNRKEAAKYLRVSEHKLAHGWGPAPLSNYTRPVMYHLADLDGWLEEQRKKAPCGETDSTNGRAPKSGGSSGVAPVGARGSLPEKALAAKLRLKLAKSVPTTNGPALELVETTPDS